MCMFSFGRYYQFYIPASKAEKSDCSHLSLFKVSPPGWKYLMVLICISLMISDEYFFFLSL